jgi:hypothetical protein
MDPPHTRTPSETQPADALAPSYDPEAVSLMQDSDENLDPEIREVQREFHGLRRELKIVLQIKVHKRDLLAHFRG